MSKYTELEAQGFATNNPILERKILMTLMSIPQSNLKDMKGLNRTYDDVCKRLGVRDERTRHHIRVALLKMTKN